jgi:hypothetical protein
MEQASGGWNPGRPDSQKTLETLNETKKIEKVYFFFTILKPGICLSSMCGKLGREKFNHSEIYLIPAGTSIICFFIIIIVLSLF